MTYVKTTLPLLCLTAALFVAPAANAAQLLAVETDKSQMISVSTAPGAVIIGNPAIADVSLQGTKVFVHGKGFGETNLVILDLDGNQIGNFDVVTRHAADSSLAVFKGTERFSYTCMPNCEAQLQVGDNEGYFTDSVAKELQKKMEIATGSKSAEAAAPAAPQ